jgi:hypothetical protein
MKQLQKFYPHLLSFFGFIIIALIYFYPVLQGKKIYQSDIVQYTAMAKEQNDFRTTENQEPFWTNSAFGGMPTYQLGAKYPNDFIGAIDDAIRFLPRPADYLFLYFLGFYGLLLVLKTDPLKAFFGALAFGFSTYLIVILGVGHNAKAHAIGYFPWVVAGVLLVFKRKYILGGLLTVFAVALEINANHFQMTYYLLFLLLFIAIYYGYQIFKSKDFASIPKIIGTFLVALIIAVGTNATSLLATQEYVNYSIRGKSELTLNPDGSKKVGDGAMDREYITEYSYGILESLNLIAPRIFGGGNGESLGKDSEIVSYLQQQQVAEDQYISKEQAEQYAADGMPTYWGDQPIVAAPAYIGAIVFFLAILALFQDKRKIKYVFLAGVIFSLLLSWGKNFGLLTDFFIDFVPLYDKFRAVSSIQVILELCMPILAIMGLQSFFDSKNQDLRKNLLQAAGISIGVLALLLLCKGMFRFSSLNDGMLTKSYGPEFMEALRKDRKTMFVADLMRSIFFIAVAFGAMYLYLKDKINATKTVLIVGIFMVADLFFVDKSYVNTTDFVGAHDVDVPFQASNADMQILQDTTDYRVLDVQGFLNARASYFHKSIGGYSAVRPKRMQELFDYQISQNNVEVLNMLNVKYVLQTDETGSLIPTLNGGANGNSWFVSEIKTVATADQEMKSLKGLDSKKTAVINSIDFNDLPSSKSFDLDSLATITLKSSLPNKLIYTSSNKNSGFAVFSEMYYKNGWIATIDGKETPILRVDYALRGIQIPSGKHSIEFKFEPQVIKTGSTIVLISTILLVVLVIFGIYFETKRRQNSKTELKS